MKNATHPPEPRHVLTVPASGPRALGRSSVCRDPRRATAVCLGGQARPEALVLRTALKELSGAKSVINIVSVTDEKLHRGISVIHSSVYGHQVLRGLPQIHLMFLSVRFSIWVFDLAERCVKTHAVRQLPTGDSSALAFT